MREYTLKLDSPILIINFVCWWQKLIISQCFNEMITVIIRIRATSFKGKWQHVDDRSCAQRFFID